MANNSTLITSQKYIPYENDDSCRVWISSRIDVDKRNDSIFINGTDGNKRVKKLSEFRTFKFLTVDNLLKSINRQNPSYLAFTSPVNWPDAYDQKLYSGVLKSNLLQQVFCFCHSYSFANDTEAMWRMYGKPWETIVRVSLRFEQLLNELNDFTKRNNADFYVSLIDYSLNQNDIKSLYGKYAKASNITIPEWISLLSLKRKAFSYEHEIRIFLVMNQDDINGFSTNQYHEVDVNLVDVISQITLPPYDPSKKWIEELSNVFKAGSFSQSQNVKRAKADISAVLPNTKVITSHLYEWK